MDSSVPNHVVDADSSSESESEAEDGTRRQKPVRRSSDTSASDAESSASDDESRDSESSSSEDEEDEESPFPTGATKRAALWHDPADDAIRVDLAADTRLRKLARGKTGREAVVGGKGLESKLREQ
jgi:U3 small nucleolar RNA-associated protein 18